MVGYRLSLLAVDSRLTHSSPSLQHEDGRKYSCYSAAFLSLACEEGICRPWRVAEACPHTYGGIRDESRRVVEMYGRGTQQSPV